MSTFRTLLRFGITCLLFLSFFSTLLAQNKAQDGDWSDVIPLDVIPVAVSNLPDGKLIVWSAKFRESFNINDDGVTYTEIYDPFVGRIGAGQGESTTNLQHDMFCPGINNLPDGRVLSAGGTSSFKTSIYDYNTGLWTAADEMNVRRAYQGNVTLPNGDVFTWGGSWSEVPPYPTSSDKVAELWNITTDSWTELTGLTGDILWNANDAALEIPAEGVYRLDNHLWLWVASNGGLFHAGPSEDMHWIDLTGAGSVSAPYSRGGDTYSMKGTTVMFDIDKILKVGGSRSYGNNTPAKENAFVIDINVPFNTAPNVQQTPDMEFERTMHNSTVLPTGQVLVTGGLDHAEVFTDNGAQLYAELFTPNAAGTNGTWETLSYMATPRTYHSVSILLTDGTVFSGGGGLSLDAFNHFNGEIFYPPYLFETDGSYKERPYINAPATSNYNATINVTGSADIDEMALVRFSAATHSTNNEQRRIPITYTEDTPGNYTVAIPDENLLPPGYYMLFAMDNGVPSLAETIQIAQPVFTGANPCDGGVNIVPEVTVNGTPNIGDDFYLLAGGENITIAANGGTITNITGPDGSITNAATVTVTGLDETTEGWYTLKTAAGCFTRVKLVINTPDTPICDPGDLTNLALNKPAKQSSVLDGRNINTDPTLVNDGVTTDINGFNHTYVETGEDDPLRDFSPWWEVDLETVANVDRVQIFNRNRPTDTQAVLDRLQNFYILTSLTPFPEDGDIMQMIKNPDYGVTYYGGTATEQITIDIGEEARYVRLHFPAIGRNRIIHIRELEVIGCEIICANPVVFGNNGPFVKNTGIEQLTANIAGGTWSGDVDEFGNFDTNVPAGTYSATYTVTDGDNCTQSASVEIIVASCAATTNVALNQFAEQSTTYNNGTANLANDGNPIGTETVGYDNGDPPDLQHTDINEKSDGTIPWWQVDLGAVTDIDNVEVFNRTDGDVQPQAVMDRLANFYVFTSMTPFNRTDTLQDIRDDAADTANTTVTETFFAGAVDGSALIPIGQQGRYVRIQLSIPDILHMAEVEVNGCTFTCTTELVMQDYEFVQNTGIEQITPVSTPAGGAGVWYGDVNATGEFDTNQPTGTYSATYVYTDADGCVQSESSEITLGLCVGVENLALNKPAKQSTTREQGAAYLAFDDDLNGDRVDYLEQADLQHTITSNEEHWLEVDLGSMATIQSFEVYNRADPDNAANIARLSDFSIFVSRLPFDEDATHAELVTAANNGEIDHYQFVGNPGLFTAFDFTTAGRYVRLHLPPNGGNRTLHISELRVFGCPNACQAATITGNDTYLETDGDVILTGTLGTNGAFGGAASTGGVFSPSTLGPGTYTVAYTYDDTDGCSQTVQKQIQVTRCDPAGTNLALNQPAEQSSTLDDGVASFAVDGNLIGDSASSGTSSDLQHTDAALTDEPAWWQVDLGVLADIDDVVIYNRTNTSQANKDRLNFFYVFVSETPFAAGVELTDLIDDTNIFHTKFYGAAGDVETIAIGAQGRYVRIQLDRGVVEDQPARILHMAEVQVFGCEVVCDPEAVLTSPAVYLDTDGVDTLEATPAGGTWSGAAVSNGNEIDPIALGLGTYIVTYTVTNAGCTQQKDFEIKVSKCSATQNLALVGTASQSSTFNGEDTLYAASFAIDGNTSQVNGPIQHTGTAPADQNQPWWQVDLGIVANIEEIRIFNRVRTDLYNRLSNFYIFTSNIPFPAGATLADLLVDPNVTNQFYNGGVGADVSIPFIAEAQYVRIQLNNATSGILHMSEVQVFGCELTNPCLGEPVTTLDPDGPFTIFDGIVNLVANPPTGGTWGGASTDGTFDPSALGAGTFNVTYTTDNGAGCVQTVDIDIVVTDPCDGIPAPTIDVVGPFTINDALQTLTANPTGGTWTLDGIAATNQFDPAALGAGSYTIVYTVDNGMGCVQSDTLVIEVTDPCDGEPVPSLDPAGPFFTNAGIQNLVFSPVGGAWGGASTDGTFDPSIGVGTYNVTYTTDNGTGCIQTVAIDIEVLDPCDGTPDAVIDPVGTLATDAGVQTLTANPTGGTWTGASTDGTFDPSVGVGFYDVTYTVDVGNGCIKSDTITIEVVLPGDPCEGITPPVIDAVGPFTTFDGEQTLTANPAGGVWSDDSTDGTFNPSVLGVGTYSVSYTVDNGAGCEQTDTITIVVNEPCDGVPPPTIDPVAPLFITDAPIALVGNPEGGTWGGASTDGTFDPSIGVGTYNVTYTVDNGAGCAQTANIDIVVTDPCEGTADVIIDPVGAIATDAGIQTLNANPVGGTWSGASTDGTFDPSIGVGFYDVTYTFDFANGCIKEDTITIEVVLPGDPCAGVDAPTIDPVAPLFTTDAVVTLVGNPAGGTWGGAATANTFDPSIGVGTYNVTYTVDNGAGCVQTANIDIVVTDPCDGTADVIINPVGAIATDEGIQTLSANPTGGTWSGASTDGTFDPSIGVGFYDVTYTVDFGNGCIKEDTITIEVVPPGDPCAGVDAPTIDPVVPLFTTDAVVTLVGNPAGGTWGGASTDGTFDPSIGVGTYNVTYTVDNGAGCEQTANIDIVVTDPCEGTADVIIDPIGAIATDEGIQTLTANPMGGTWSDASTDGTFDPSVGVGFYDVTYTVDFGNGCVKSDTITIEVVPPGDPCIGVTPPTIDPVAPLFITDAAVNLMGNPAGGTWGGASTDGTFDPSMGVGTYNVTYTVDNGAGCVQTANIDIVVTDPCEGTADVIIDPIGAIATDEGIQTLTASPMGGTWSDASTDGTFDPSVGVGFYDVTYTVDFGNGCVKSDTITIEVVPPGDPCAGIDAPTINPVAPLFITDAVVNLVGNPAGGTWGGASTDGTFDPSMGVGTYNVTYTVDNGAGCVQTANIDIVVTDPCEGTVTLTLDEAGPFTTDDPIQILAASPSGGMWGGDANKIGDFDPSRGPGTYTVTYTYTDPETGCSAEGSMEIIVEPGLETLDVDGFIIYPVPTNGELNISLENYMNELVQVRIVDASSRVVFERVFDNSHSQVETIDLSYLSNGIYHLLFDSMGYVSDVTFTVNK